MYSIMNSPHVLHHSVLFAAAVTSCHLCSVVGYCSDECCAKAQSKYHWLECGDAQHLLKVRMTGLGCIMFLAHRMLSCAVARMGVQGCACTYVRTYFVCLPLFFVLCP